MVFAIRTRRVPFFHSHPSIPLMLAALDVVAVGGAAARHANRARLWLPAASPATSSSPWREALGYLLLIELGKRAFDGAIPATTRPVRKRADDGRRFLRRRAAHRGGADGLS